MIFSYFDSHNNHQRAPTTTVEVAIVDVKHDNETICSDVLSCAADLLTRCDDYLSHETQVSAQHPGRYIWLVRWRTREENPKIFRSTPEYRQWRQLLGSL
ncbi:hypothetical protein P886_2456 [Alteromonadaceae bacterium 2753L.S.0a.02]|nr:hypothetical protein P886_2456 [Alteromonadaceae bacterium 2753L.S.0a.02]